MKMYYGIFVISLMILQSCSKDVNEISNTADEHITSITAKIDKATSRLNFEDSENMIKVKWGAAESFSLFSGTDSQSPTIFTKDNTNIESSTSFKGNVSLADNSNIYAVYPATSLTSSPSSVSIDFSNQDGLLTTIQNKAPMFSNAVYKTSETSNLSFMNAACILRMKLTFPSAISVSSLTLSSSTLHNKAALDITGSSTASCWTFNEAGKGDIKATFSPVLATSSGNIITAYLLVLPEDFSNVEISCSDGTDTYTSSLSSTAGSLTAGKVYTVTKDMVKIEKIIEYTTAVEAAAGVQPTVGDGSSDNPYQLSTPENIKWLKEQADGNNLTAGKYYKLMYNVKVTSATWSSIGGKNSTNRSFQGVFDGDNHVFTGTLTAESTRQYWYGLFGTINGGCVKNLINKATVNATHSTMDSRIGGIAGNVVPQTNFVTAIINCQNYGNVTGPAEVGGIVGHVEPVAAGTSDFTIISGCKNYGNVISTSTTASRTPAGGIIGYITPKMTSGTTKVESCENYGNVTASKTHAGGLVGLIDATKPVAISNCIESSTVTIQANSVTATSELGVATAFAGKLWGAVWTPASFTSTNNVIK
jgi:hypothetical protein